MGLCEADTMLGEGPCVHEAAAAEGGLDRGRRALRGVKALVVGLASTGLAASRFLAGCGAVVTATDLRPEDEIPGAGGLKALGVRIEAGGHMEGSFRAAGLVVVSPGVPHKSPFLNAAREAGAEVISEIELAS